MIIIRQFFSICLTILLTSHWTYAAVQESDAIKGGRFVLSGGAGIGKSTVIDLLQQKGYQTIQEVWTMLFNEAKAADSLEEFYPTVITTDFREKLMDLQLSFEASLNRHQSAFLDRSCVDTIAFGYYYDIPMSQDLIDIPKKHRYDLVFFLDPLPEELYQKNVLLKCSQEESMRMHLYLKKVYQEYGYDIIDVPFCTPEERIAFILNVIAQTNK